MTIKELLNEMNKIIDYNDCEILLQFILNCNKNFLIINQYVIVEEKEISKALECAQKVKNGIPIQYITNFQYFYGDKFYVDDNVLIPQPDTEILVKKAIDVIKKENIKSVLDLCTGSGAIAISIKKECKDVEMYASDISKTALKVANKNAKELIGEEHNVNFIESNLFDNINGKFDMIISNPPYIKSDVIKTLDKEVQMEPLIALDGGKDGLDFYKRIKKDIGNHLNKVLLLEIGYDQKEEVLNIFNNGICYKDFGGNDRVIEWRI